MEQGRHPIRAADPLTETLGCIAAGRIDGPGGPAADAVGWRRVTDEG